MADDIDMNRISETLEYAIEETARLMRRLDALKVRFDEDKEQPVKYQDAVPAIKASLDAISAIRMVRSKLEAMKPAKRDAAKTDLPGQSGSLGDNEEANELEASIASGL